MNKMLRAIVVVIILSLITTTSTVVAATQIDNALASLAKAEVIAYVGNSGYIGMPEAAHPSMLYRLLYGNPKSHNSLNGSSKTLLNELEELQAIINSLDPEVDFVTLEEASFDETRKTFTERLLILEDKLELILSQLPDSGINNDKQKARILSRVAISLEISFGLTNMLNTECVDFSALKEGDSVEGLGGVMVPFLEIDTPSGGAVKIIEYGTLHAYGSPNLGCEPPNINTGIEPGGGFSDLIAVGKEDPHSYTFFFDGVTVRAFTLHMLDYGDFNPKYATEHSAVMIAFDGVSAEVSSQVIEYTSSNEISPLTSDYGNLHCNNGDATADEGYPGNWTWNVTGEGISKVTLTFPEGYDPYIGFDSLCYVVEP